MVSSTTQVWQGLGIDEGNCSAKIIKVVAGEERESLEIISRTYNTIIDAGIYQATLIKVAESAKVIENT